MAFEEQVNAAVMFSLSLGLFTACFHRRGRYSLSPRTLLELYPYLKANYGDEMIECTICHEVSVHRCSLLIFFNKPVCRLSRGEWRAILATALSECIFIASRLFVTAVESVHNARRSGLGNLLIILSYLSVRLLYEMVKTESEE